MSMLGAFKRFSCLIIFDNFLAKSMFTLCPGFLAITLPLILLPTKAKSPIIYDVQLH